jgi:SAM-dependent methyltransferase
MSQKGASVSTVLDIAEEVRNFYDLHPYPPPVESLEKYQQRWSDRQTRRADFHLFWPGRTYEEDYSILVAGCGTSQAAKHALRWPAAQVVGIDSSETSVRHTERLIEAHDIRNLEVRRCAIDRVADLDRSFDRIVCTGVLHHLWDPRAALESLRDVLKPDGAMHLMVYAPYGRAGVYMLQEFCRRIGIHPSGGEIRDLITALCALPRRHPLEALLAEAPELRDERALADALLNPHDRAYSVPELFDLIESAGLEFGRWLRQAPYSAICGILGSIPQVAHIAALPIEEQYAVAELFRGTMVRHSVVVYRRDCPDGLRRISFAGDNWLRYVPIRMPDTVCLQDGVPVGAAAVLINRTHTYKDLFLSVGPAEKQLFDAIDGKRTICEIAKTVASSSRITEEFDRPRTFFEQLWRYDQVVFDTHGAPSDP